MSRVTDDGNWPGSIGHVSQGEIAGNPGVTNGRGRRWEFAEKPAAELNLPNHVGHQRHQDLSAPNRESATQRFRRYSSLQDELKPL